MESGVALLFFISFVYSMASIEGEIRCYCNESECVSAGYMCKSSVGLCYTRLEYEDDSSRQTQGCVDSLIQSDREMCYNTNSASHNSKMVSSRDVPLLVCCSNDMCNYYYKNNDVTIDIFISSKANHSKHKTGENSKQGFPAERHIPSLRTDAEKKSEGDLWFKAAVIAVPIAGGFILILLVLLAVRMLRTDSRRHRQLLQFRRERTALTKAHLYVTDHFAKKPDKSGVFGEKYNKACKDTNFKVDKDGKVYEKVSDSKHSTRPPSSVILMGDNSREPFASVV